jgi:uncharacterized protein YecE (DUF72 family)
MASARIGTSGFSYAHWRGAFFPETLSPRRWLEYYMDCFDTVELNVTFYRLPCAPMVASWARRATAGFLYAVKLSRYITHTKRLRDAAEPLARFLERLCGLGSHLGPVLVQLPPGMARDAPRLDDFLARCDSRLRWAVEVRDPSWFDDEVYAVLARHGAALCIHDMLDNHPRVLTAEFAYVRFHGVAVRYGGSYPDPILRAWADTIHGWTAAGRDVYAYFNNDQHAYAVANARTLRTMIDTTPSAREIPQ